MLQEVLGTPALRTSPSVSSSAKNKSKYSSELIQGFPHSHAEKARPSSPSANRADVGYTKALLCKSVLLMRRSLPSRRLIGSTKLPLGSGRNPVIE